VHGGGGLGRDYAVLKATAAQASEHVDGKAAKHSTLHIPDTAGRAPVSLLDLCQCVEHPAAPLLQDGLLKDGLSLTCRRMAAVKAEASAPRPLAMEGARSPAPLLKADRCGTASSRPGCVSAAVPPARANQSTRPPPPTHLSRSSSQCPLQACAAQSLCTRASQPPHGTHPGSVGGWTADACGCVGVRLCAQRA